MPYKIEQSSNPSGMTTYFYGVLTDEELLQSCKDRVDMEEVFKSLVFLRDDFVDVTEFKVTSQGVQQAAQITVNASKLNDDIVYVSIMPTDLLYGMARMWQAFSDKISWKINIVRTREEAKAWWNENGIDILE